MDDSPPAESPFTVYPVPVDGHVPVDKPGLRVHAVAPDPPSHVQPVGQGAHVKFWAGGLFVELAGNVNRKGPGTRNCPAGQDNEPVAGDIHVPE